jgi:circadian clock protein KaiC
MTLTLELPNSKVKNGKSQGPALKKTRTGINGFDEITLGGLPKGRPSLVCGSAGCGKTLFSLEFLIRGAIEFNEPGVFISFEEKERDLIENVASLGFDLKKLIAQKKILVDHIRVDRNEIEEAGDYNLDGIFVRLAHAIDSIGAKRVVLDTIEALFSGLTNQIILRSEIRRLFHWLKDRGVTAVITGERGGGQLTRHGLEEYVSDCVILLDHRVTDQVSTRRLRIVKYRGSSHGTNEYPFLIDEKGISVLPITSLGLNHDVSNERISSGIPRLDAMLGGKGFFRGSSIMVSGTPGTGKSSLCAHLAREACQKGKKALYFAFEESPKQIMRNMKSINVDLEPYVKNGLLHFHSTRPSAFGLEMHLAIMHKMIQDFQPDVVIVDPMNNLMSAGSAKDVHAMLVRLVDFLKQNKITAFFTNLSNQEQLEATEAGLSSIMDTWILLRDIEIGGERNRGLYILKSRGMAHSNQIREFLITNKGIDLIDVYQGPEGVLTGTARATQEAREKAEEVIRQESTERKKRDIERKRKLIEAQILSLKHELDSSEEELHQEFKQEDLRRKMDLQSRKTIANLRRAD